jgi:phage/plasmid primase-like uncharacterized protein
VHVLTGDERAQFDTALRAHNLIPPKDVIADGNFYRCDVHSRNGKDDGSYVVHADGTIPAGGFQNWQDGNGFVKWRYEPRGRQRTVNEDAEADKKVEEARKRHEAEMVLVRKHAAEEAQQLWDIAEPATAEHPYLKKKRVQPHGIRVITDAIDGETLIIPLLDAAGMIHTVEQICVSGKKMFLSGGAKKGHYYPIPGRDDVIYICEGFATAATVHEATGSMAIVAMDGGNLKPVAQTVRQQFPGADIVICADDDRWTDGNPGLHHARAAAYAIQADIAVPTFGMNRREKRDSDFNDLADLLGAEHVRSSLADRMSPDECLVWHLGIDPDAAPREDIAKELADLRQRDPAAFEKLRKDLKKAGVRCKVLDEAVDDAEDEDEEPAHPKQVDVLLSLVRDNDVELFHVEDKTAYAAIIVDGHREVYPVHSTDFRDWLVHRFYKEWKSSPSSEARASALMSIGAQARFEGKCRNVYLRVAELDGKLYIDLCDAKWRAIEISPASWSIVAEPPVLFRRKAGMMPLPVPVSGGSVELLRPFLNLRDGEDGEHEFVMLVSFLLAALSPVYPYPALAVTGVQGAAKSWTSELLRKLIDPNSVGLRVMPHDARSLYIQAHGSHALCFNNVSSIPTWISDCLCCLLDGDGSSARALFTDADEMLFGGAHPMILNGIEDFVVRPDLAERTITITLHEMDDDRRRERKELRRQFDEARPLILGALLDVMACGLKTMAAGLTVERLPRLADFARWGIACEAAAFHPGAFMAAFTRNRAETTRIVLEADAVAQAVIALMKMQPEGWQGTATKLLGDLKTVIDEEAAKAKDWPKAANALSNRLRRATPDLRKAGIAVRDDQVGHEKTRTIFISYVRGPDKRKKSSSASSASLNDNDPNALDGGENADDAENPASAPSAIVRTSSATDAANPLKGNGAADADDEFSAKSVPGKHGCAQCNAADGEVLGYLSDDGWVHLHAICRPFWLKAQRGA